MALFLKDGISAALKKIQGSTAALTGQTNKLHGGLSKISSGLKVGLVRSAALAGSAISTLAYNVKLGVDSLIDLELKNKQTAAVLLSTKDASGQTAQGIRDMSQAFEDLTTIDDKTVQGAANVLLTFTNIGKDAFKPTLQAALDLSTAMGQDLQTSVVQVGKALNDPVKGLTALTRIGVSFTAEQKSVILGLVGTGKALDDLKLSGVDLTKQQEDQIKTLSPLEDAITAAKLAGVQLTDKQREQLVAMKDGTGAIQAQQVILGELSKEFGGSAVAAADTYQGQMNRLKDAVEGLRMSLAEALLPAITIVSKKLNTFLRSDEAQAGIKQLGSSLAKLFSNENLDAAEAALKGIFGYLKGLPWDTISQGLEISGQAAKMAVDAFRSLPPGVQGSLITLLAANKLTGGLVASGLADIGSVILKSLTTINAGNVTVIGANVSGGGGVPGVPGVPGKGPGVGGILGLGALLLLLQGSQGDPSSVQGDRPVVPGHAVDDNGYLSNDPRSPLYRILETDQRATALLKAIGDEQDPGTQLRLLQDAGLATNDMTAKVNLGVKNVGDLVKGSAAAQIHASRLDSVNLSERLAQHVDAAKNKASNDAVTTREHNMRAAAAALAEQQRNKQQNRDLSVREQYRMERVKDAIRGTTEALRHKKLSVTVNTSTKVNISAREVLSQQTSFRRWGGVTLD